MTSAVGSPMTRARSLPRTEVLHWRVFACLRWSCFDGQQCCLENKRHDHEKRTIKTQSRLGKAGSSQTQIRRRIQTAGIGHGPERSEPAFSGRSAWDQREPDPSLEARVSD